jgi:NAD(P)-dependent dehydrogenase (short-subunit alcohol dehydrogenase family)
MTDKIWLITGASRGLGAEIAKAVLAAGDTLIATARNQTDLQLLGSSEHLLTLSMDVTNEAQVQAAVAAGLDRFERIDVLVNNAGFGLLGAIKESSSQEVESIYRTNVFGLLNVIRAVLPSMRQHRSGHIIISHRSVAIVPPQAGGYTARQSLRWKALPKPCMMSCHHWGIHATVVEPGYFRTDFLESSSLRKTTTQIPDYAETVGKTRDFAAGHNHQQPGNPTKLAAAILQLAAADKPPLRLPLGTDTLQAIADKNATSSER